MYACEPDSLCGTLAEDELDAWEDTWEPVDPLASLAWAEDDAKLRSATGMSIISGPRCCSCMKDDTYISSGPPAMTKHRF